LAVAGLAALPVWAQQQIDGDAEPMEARSKADIAMMQARTVTGKLRNGRDEAAYERGTRALDEHKYEEAVALFTAVIDSKSPRADGATYWKAYALNRAGRRDEALAALAALRRDYPGSHWLNDAQALESEVKQSSGQPVSPAQESNEDLKLMAINSLMNADPERAIPLLEGLLKGSSSPRLKDRAMFVLTQNRSARAEQVLTDYAKGAGNPDLQIRAIRYIGESGTGGAQQQLAGIYAASNDPVVKREVIRSLMVSRGRDPLASLAKNEKDPELRAEAIRQLGAMRATDQLAQLYASEASPDNRIQIVRALVVAGGSDKILELMRAEKDENVRREGIRGLTMSHAMPPDTIASLYAQDGDPKTKRAVIDGLFQRGDAKALIDLARKESDPAMKRVIVERLSVMRSKEAADYMMELLK
jgi:tetratricopeptide (TPR) repeat protein